MFARSSLGGHDGVLTRERVEGIVIKEADLAKRQGSGKIRAVRDKTS